MRSRLLIGGPAALADHELLEMVLFLALPRRDAKLLVRALLGNFGSFAAAIAAPLSELRNIEGMTDAVAAALKTVQAGSVRLARAEIVDRPLLNNWNYLIEYLNTVMARERVEQFRVLFLDTRYRLLADEAQARGTVDHVSAYPREIVKRALELHAMSVILVHNHPSGSINPSRQDVIMTKEISKALKTMSISLFDHIIIGNGSYFSLKQEDLLID